MSVRESGEDRPTPEGRRIFETRWWMWFLAVVTLVATTDVRIRLDREWDRFLVVESVLALIGLVLTCGLWRGKVVSGFLAIGAALTIVKAVQIASGI